MKIRSILLLFTVVLLITAAPAVMADGCFRCVPLPAPHCANAIHVIGHFSCVTDDTGCHVFDDECQLMFSAPLASEYRVVAVVRADEPVFNVAPRTAAAAPVASSETEPAQP